jgi:hypothetical protein
LAVELLAVRNGLAAARRGGNNSLCALLSEKLSQTVGIISFVGDQAMDWSGCSKKGRRQRDIVDVAR